VGIVEAEISAECRARLALKGRILYGKFCGTGGQGICAESFALYHIWRGESEIARDLLAYLETEIQSLRGEDPTGRLALTEELAARIRRHLAAEGDDPPDSAQWAAILKAKKARIEPAESVPGTLRSQVTASNDQGQSSGSPALDP
jgi:hypothetical protein